VTQAYFTARCLCVRKLWQSDAQKRAAYNLCAIVIKSKCYPVTENTITVYTHVKIRVERSKIAFHA